MQAAIAGGVVPTFDETLWTKHKGAFIEAQHGKCGYCEVQSMNHYGAVEHYAPKSEVRELIADGGETKPTANVRHRKTRPLCDRGYWWLAYAWSNWLFACERCNSAWKGCLYPVREETRRLPPSQGVRETPLLLNPFGGADPSRHLRFTRIGQIVTNEGSDRGEATIRTCGLDRESLRRARKHLAADVHRYAERLMMALEGNNFVRACEAAEDLLSLGDEKRPHAGMVRAIVRVELGCDWPQLPVLLERLRAQARSQA